VSVIGVRHWTAHAAVALLWLAGGTRGLAQTADPKGDAARGKARAAACLDCHAPGKPQPLTPALAGQQEKFLLLQLILIREGLRDVPPMSGMLKGLKDTDLADLAAYFSALRPAPQPPKRDAQRYAQGKQAALRRGCGSCHMAGYIGQEQVPRIAGQYEDYLIASLTAFRDNKRSGVDTSMNEAMYQVSDTEIAALAHFLAQQ
jgi:cytochrome c553